MPNDLQAAQDLSVELRRPAGRSGRCSARWPTPAREGRNGFSYEWANLDLNPATNDCCLSFNLPGAYRNILVGNNTVRTWYDALEFRLDRPYRPGERAAGAPASPTRCPGRKPRAWTCSASRTSAPTFTTQRPITDDQRHRVVANWVVDLPYLWGIQFSGIATFATGKPFNDRRVLRSDAAAATSARCSASSGDPRSRTWTCGCARTSRASAGPTSGSPVICSTCSTTTTSADFDETAYHRGPTESHLRQRAPWGLRPGQLAPVRFGPSRAAGFRPRLPVRSSDRYHPAAGLRVLPLAALVGPASLSALACRGEAPPPAPPVADYIPPRGRSRSSTRSSAGPSTSSGSDQPAERADAGPVADASRSPASRRWASRSPPIRSASSGTTSAGRMRGERVLTTLRFFWKAPQGPAPIRE